MIFECGRMMRRLQRLSGISHFLYNMAAYRTVVEKADGEAKRAR
jgi:hypothetical protein